MRLGEDFFSKSALCLAQDVLGKKIIRVFDDGTIEEFIITEAEAYCGEEDLACHASKGRTNRTEVMYQKAGKVYVYLIYGMYWMLNFVCAEEGQPHAVLIRGVKGISGPGRVGKRLALDRTFYGEDLTISKRIWLEDGLANNVTINCSKRIGVEYAGKKWANKPYRFFIKLL